MVAGIVSGESGAYQTGANEALGTTVETRNGRISIEATVTELATQTNRQVIRVEGLSSADLVSPLNALAKRLNSGATYFSAKNAQALEAFTGAAESSNLEGRIQLLEASVRADPTFGLAYAALAETLTEAGKDSAPVLAAAASHRSSFTPVDGARFDAISARISHAPLAKQEQAARAALKFEPNQVDELAALGSTQFLRGDANSGQRLLSRALELSPGNQNLRQQLALGLLETKRFADAEKILVGIDNNPGVLPALAICIYLEGDVNRADIVFNRFLSLRPPNDPLTPLFRAEWLAASGRAVKAIDSLQGANFSKPNLNNPNLNNPGLRSLALSQMAVWQLMQGDLAGAKRSAASASQIDKRPASFAALVLLLTRGDAPAARWREQVNAFAASDQVRQTVLGYGYFLNRHYAEAAQVWQQILDRSGGGDLRARAMLAGSLEGAGRAAEAQKILVEPFVPDFGDLYAAVSFDQMHRLLSVGVR